MNIDRATTLAVLADIASALQAQSRLEALETELRTERAEHVRTAVKLSALEKLRPHWAQGYTSDSVAAQTATAALAQIWDFLGVDNQSSAMDALRRLTEKDAA
ncbi:hypothetical protein [Luteibacter yeojuensis]|uniref:Uncharacterized protein n=1 Tax=Luteibacter yeojuensis TaxID=345309 RepID=A0A7X5TPC9_9GAMM|nr:hypothetical protein [Luteibacter yeojuensis]NID14342.1 hypothetical protein [Luteibacter yeojuensis]